MRTTSEGILLDLVSLNQRGNTRVVSLQIPDLGLQVEIDLHTRHPVLSDRHIHVTQSLDSVPSGRHLDVDLGVCRRHAVCKHHLLHERLGLIQAQLGDAPNELDEQ